jgi:hypothetical protein
VVCLIVLSAISLVCGLGFFESIGSFVGFAEENHVQLTNEGYFAYLRQKQLFHPSKMVVAKNSTIGGWDGNSFVPKSIEKLLKLPISLEMEQKLVNSTVIMSTDSMLNTSKSWTTIDHNNNNININDNDNNNDAGHKEELVGEIIHSNYKNDSVGHGGSTLSKNPPVFDSDHLVSRVSFDSPNLFTNTKNDTKLTSSPPKVDFQTTNQSFPYITVRNKTKPLGSNLPASKSKPQHVENVFTVEYRNNCAIANGGIIMTFVGLFISIML